MWGGCHRTRRRHPPIDVASSTLRRSSLGRTGLHLERGRRSGWCPASPRRVPKVRMWPRWRRHPDPPADSAGTCQTCPSRLASAVAVAASPSPDGGRARGWPWPSLVTLAMGFSGNTLGPSASAPVAVHYTAGGGESTVGDGYEVDVVGGGGEAASSGGCKVAPCGVSGRGAEALAPTRAQWGGGGEGRRGWHIWVREARGRRWRLPGRRPVTAAVGRKPGGDRIGLAYCF